jgi:hypothetical protein
MSDLRHDRGLSPAESGGSETDTETGPAPKMVGWNSLLGSQEDLNFAGDKHRAQPGCDAPASSCVKVGLPRRYRLPAAGAVIALVVVGAYVSAAHVREVRGREPLRVVEAASSATGQPVGIISPSTADAWSSRRSPSEADVQVIDQAGNAYLEPLFYATTTSSLPIVPPGRCYYLAVQEGKDFDADAVSRLLRLCFEGSNSTPTSISGAPASTS